MMRTDSLERADAEAAPFADLPLVHVWDAERQAGNLYSKILGLQSTWDEDDPPEPAFAMTINRHKDGDFLPCASEFDRAILA